MPVLVQFAFSVDDHPILREGVGALIASQRDMRLVALIHGEVAAELASHAGDDALSAREIEVLSLIAAGNSNKLIADESPDQGEARTHEMAQETCRKNRLG